MAAALMNFNVHGAQAVINYVFNDPFILWEALNAAGSNVSSAGNRTFFDGNKRLALLGDTVLKTALVDDWYPSGQPRVNGANLVDSVVTNANLAATGDHHGIGQFVNNNPSQRGVVSAVTMATTVEAIIGAVFLDSDFDTVKEVMQTLGLH